GNLTTLIGVTATVDNDPHVADRWNEFIGGSLTVDGGSYNLPALADLDQSRLHVQTWGQLALPNVTSYVAPHPTFQAAAPRRGPPTSHDAYGHWDDFCPRRRHVQPRGHDQSCQRSCQQPGGHLHHRYWRQHALGR